MHEKRRQSRIKLMKLQHLKTHRRSGCTKKKKKRKTKKKAEEPEKEKENQEIVCREA